MYTYSQVAVTRPANQKPYQFLFCRKKNTNYEGTLYWATFRNNQLQKRSLFLVNDLEFFTSENRCRNGHLQVSYINIFLEGVFLPSQILVFIQEYYMVNEMLTSIPFFAGRKCLFINWKEKERTHSCPTGCTNHFLFSTSSAKNSVWH